MNTRYSPAARWKRTWHFLCCLGNPERRVCSTNSVMNAYPSFKCSLRGIRRVFRYFSSSAMTFGICVEIRRRQDAERSYDHLIKGILQNSERKSCALGVTAEAWKGPSSWRNKLLQAAIPLWPQEHPLGNVGKERRLGTYQK